MSQASNTPSVRIGQKWRDNDWRSQHREGVVIDVDMTHATVRWNAGNKTRIRLNRFRRNSTGYVLLRDVNE